MRILDKYILGKLFGAYLTILLSFMGLYFIIDLFSTLSHILESKPPLPMIVSYYMYSLPLMFLRTNPLALLVSAVYTIGELNKHNETISMRASGLSILRISAVVIFFPVVVSVFSFFIQEKVLINSQKQLEEIKVTYIKKKSEAMMGEERNVAFSSDNLLFFIDRFLPKKGELYNVVIFEQDANENIVKKIVCQKIVHEGTQWKGKGVMEYALDTEGDGEKEEETFETFYWEEKEIPLKEKPENLTLKRSQFFEFYPIKALRKEIRKFASIKSRKVSDLLIIYHKKLSDPFSGLFLILGTLPFALEIKKRRVGLSSLGIGVIFYIIYFVILSISIPFGKIGILLSPLSPWIAPIFFSTVGLFGILHVR